MSAVLDTLVAFPTRKFVASEQRLSLAEYKRQDHIHEAEEGMTVERLLESSYWAHIPFGKIQLYDRMEVRIDTGEWIAELIVVGCARGWIQMYLAKLYNLDMSTSAEAPNSQLKYDIKYKGYKKWCVIRREDSVLLQEGMDTKALAQTWLDQHERVAT